MASEAFSFWQKKESENQKDSSNRSASSSPKQSRGKVPQPRTKETAEERLTSTRSIALQLDHSELFKPLPSTFRQPPSGPAKKTSRQALSNTVPHHKLELNSNFPRRESDSPSFAQPLGDSEPTRSAQPVSRSRPQRVAAPSKSFEGTLPLESYRPSLVASHSPSPPTKRPDTRPRLELPEQQQSHSGKEGGEKEKEDPAPLSAPPTLVSGRKGSWSRSQEKGSTPPRRRVTWTSKQSNSFISYLDGPLDAVAVESQLASVSGFLVSDPFASSWCFHRTFLIPAYVCNAHR